MVENLTFTIRRGKNGNQKEDANPLPRFLVATPCSNCAFHLHFHLPIATHLPLQPQKGEKPL